MARKTKEEKTESTAEDNNNIPEEVEINMRRFFLRRDEDETGISGTGYVAEGIEFTDGSCTIKWLTATSSVGYYASVKAMIGIHGHGGKTTVVFVDE